MTQADDIFKEQLKQETDRLFFPSDLSFHDGLRAAVWRRIQEARPVRKPFWRWPVTWAAGAAAVAVMVLVVVSGQLQRGPGALVQQSAQDAAPLAAMQVESAAPSEGPVISAAVPEELRALQPAGSQGKEEPAGGGIEGGDKVQVGIATLAPAAPSSLAAADDPRVAPVSRAMDVNTRSARSSYRPGAEVEFTVEVANRTSQPLALHSLPARLVVRSLQLGQQSVFQTPLTDLAGRTLPPGDSRTVEVVWQASEQPGYYLAQVEGLQTAQAAPYTAIGGTPAQVFIEYPPGAVREGIADLGQSAQRNFYALVPEVLEFTSTETLLRFRVEAEGGRQIPRNLTLALTHGQTRETPIRPLQLTPDGTALVGLAHFHPVSREESSLTITMDRLEVVNSQGTAHLVYGPWEITVTLER